MSDNNQDNQSQSQSQSNQDDLNTQSQSNQQSEAKKTAEMQARELAKANKELQAKIKAYEDAQSQAEAKKLEEQGKFKELLEKERAEKTQLLETITKKEQNDLIQKSLQKAGVNPDFVDLLSPNLVSQIEFKDGVAVNIDTIINDLKTNKPSLFSDSITQAKNLGTNVTTNSNSSDDITLDRALEILEKNDAKEIQKYQKQIQKALNQ